MKRYIKPITYLAIGLLLPLAGTVFAADPSAGIGGVASKVTESFESIGKLMIAIAYIAGIAFAIAGIFKFKQHKDNPTQIPLGTPLALLVIGIALVFLPNFFEPAGQTLFGDAAKSKAGGPTGSGFEALPGAKGSSGS